MIELLLAAQVAVGAFHGCPAQGDVTSARTQALNRLKNRGTAPAPSAINPDITMKALGAYFHDDRTRWSNDDGATITGWVIAVTSGGSESVNCHKAGLRDVHIDLAADPQAKKPHVVIVEVTPRWQAAMRADGTDWSLAALRRLVGHQVTFTGWMMFDFLHADASENTHRGRGNWRQTAFEIHPITDI